MNVISFLKVDFCPFADHHHFLTDCPLCPTAAAGSLVVLLVHPTFLQVDHTDAAGVHDQHSSVLSQAEHVLRCPGVVEPKVQAVGGQALGDMQELIRHVGPLLHGGGA